MASLDQLPPEILMTILDELRMSELAAVIRVNRQFFNLGIRRLWQAQRDIYLAKVPKDRRRVYTPLIQELDLDGAPKALYEEFKDLEFDNVKELSVTLKEDLDTIDDCGYLTHFINPGLQLLDLEGDITPDFLLDVQNQCPKLRTVNLWRCGSCVAPEDFLAFLRGLAYLESLRINMDHVCMADSKVIEFLATSSTLEQLTLEQIYPVFLTDALTVEAPFAQLKRLDIEITQDAFASIAKLFSSVLQLRVTFRATDSWDRRETEVVRIRPLSEMTELRTLEISFHDETILVPEDLVTLRSLRNLASLSLHGLSEVHLGAAEFSDDHFHRLVSGLQDLVTLSLHPYPGKVTSASLAALAKCCPHLETCFIGGEFNVLGLQDYDAPLFPRLAPFRVRCFLDPDKYDGDPVEVIERRAGEHAQQLERHFPKADIQVLQGWFSNPGSFTSTVMRLLRPRNERDFGPS
ncbi:hypothetical protein CNMCM8927_007558 [Aspergillus lentulus]|uniref:F-box domain-containing protein n=1 Tax=Aspergillus lentulus TaxID=293939 RepID=A0AAN5YVA9_ASPLE|nr:hypothetical protein CNMCM8060_002735 [Aspergillus lentulus]KAF4180210.1 hypothetical protein CNMCM7927_001405 [Aspergillus lentulus]KAF4197871.1 hypothetical protein CNMCM8694_001537 [Aspergillus lentulus]KAF4209191.1 hypothetical protein CNMCM8927_007558 [Aspergillus lentulus]